MKDLRAHLDAWLADWDGKTVAYLEEGYQEFSSSPHFLPELVALIREPNAQEGASWWLKHALEQGHEFPNELWTELTDSLSEMQGWPSQLHLLQSLQYLSIPAAQVSRLKLFAEGCLNSKNKFVRAWSYDAFHRLGRVDSSLEEQVHRLLERGLAEEAPSVRARIRRIVQGQSKAKGRRGRTKS